MIIASLVRWPNLLYHYTQNIDEEPERHRRFIKKHPIVLNNVKKSSREESLSRFNARVCPPQ
jgi:hypothetical protein